MHSIKKKTCVFVLRTHCHKGHQADAISNPHIFCFLPVAFSFAFVLAYGQCLSLCLCLCHRDFCLGIAFGFAFGFAFAFANVEHSLALVAMRFPLRICTEICQIAAQNLLMSKTTMRPKKKKMQPLQQLCLASTMLPPWRPDNFQ